MKKLTTEERAIIAEIVRDEILTAECSAHTDLTVEKVKEIIVAENGFWDNPDCVAVQGDWMTIEGPDKDTGEYIEDDTLVILYDTLTEMGPKIDIRQETQRDYIPETKTIGHPRPSRPRRPR